MPPKKYHPKPVPPGDQRSWSEYAAAATTGLLHHDDGERLLGTSVDALKKVAETAAALADFLLAEEQRRRPSGGTRGRAS